MKIKLLLLPVIMAVLITNLFAEKGFRLLATFQGKSPGDAFSEVCGLGDINQDGYDDFAVGAWESLNGGGYVNIYFGGSVLDTVADLKLTGGSYFGWSMDCGDFNGDGIPDLIVGAPNSNFFYGSVSIFFGGEDMDTIPDITINGTHYNGFFGSSVANGGDINGDGYEDFIVGAYTAWETCGYLYIFFGGPAVDDFWDYCLQGAVFDQIGCSCDGIGDINQDGYDDIIVGSLSMSGRKLGRAYIILGGSVLNNSSIVILEDSTEREFGRHVSGVGDINNDSIPDFLISSEKTGRNQIGIVNIYSGNSKELIYKFIGFNKNGRIISVSKNVDVDRDNNNDLLVGYGDSSSLYSGRILCYLGYKNFDTIPDYTLQGKTQHQYFGCSIAEIGNINDDDNIEIAIGQRGQHFYNNSPSELTYGKVFIYSFGDLSQIKEDANCESFYLKQNYPNPFNTHTTIEFALDYPADVVLSIYDINGNLIEILEKNHLQKGKYKYTFNKINLTSGIYFYKLNVNGKSIIKKMTYLK